MNFPKLLRLIVMPLIKQETINSTTPVTKKFIHPVEIELASLLAHAHKFSYELVSPSDGEVGRLLPNGTWTGMAGMLLRKEGDVMISIVTITAERMEIIDFSFPYLRSPITFATIKPGYSSDITAVLKPFDTDLWISLVAFLLILPAIFLPFLKGRCTYGKLLLSTFRSLLTQSLCISPQNIKEYFLMFFYILGAIFFIHSYTCVLLSFITFPTLTGVRTIHELAAAVVAGKYHCVSYPGTFVGTALAMSNDPNFRIVGRNMLQNEGSSDVLGVLKSSTQNSKRAFIAAAEALLPFKPEYFVSEDEFFPLYFAIGMRKDFCCREQVTRFVLYICSTGLYQKVLDRFSFRLSLKHVYNNGEGSSDQSIRQFSLEDIEGAFFLLGAGYALSAAVFFLEIIFQRFSKNFKYFSGFSQIHSKRAKV